MLNPWLTLLLLHVVIFLSGSTILWACDRWPRTVVIVSGFIVAGGAWAIWSAGDVIEADGLEVGECWLRVGQWAVALGIAAWGLVAAIRKSQSAPAARTAWFKWAIALAAYWLLCFLVALFEGFVIFLGTTPHGQFR